MASIQRDQVRRFLQILWTPTEGDRVIMRHQKKLCRGTVQGKIAGVYFQSITPGASTLSREMFFVPRKADFDNLLKKMADDKIITLTPGADGMYQMCRRFKKFGHKTESYSFVQGSAQTCLYSLLGARLNDIAINQYFNELVLRRRKDESVECTILPFPV